MIMIMSICKINFNVIKAKFHRREVKCTWQTNQGSQPSLAGHEFWHNLEEGMEVVRPKAISENAIWVPDHC